MLNKTKSVHIKTHVIILFYTQLITVNILCYSLHKESLGIGSYDAVFLVQQYSDYTSKQCYDEDCTQNC